MRKFKDPLDEHLAEVQRLEKEALKLIVREMREFRKKKTFGGARSVPSG